MGVAQGGPIIREHVEVGAVHPEKPPGPGQHVVDHRVNILGVAAHEASGQVGDQFGEAQLVEQLALHGLAIRDIAGNAHVGLHPAVVAIQRGGVGGVPAPRPIGVFDPVFNPALLLAREIKAFQEFHAGRQVVRVDEFGDIASGDGFRLVPEEFRPVGRDVGEDAFG